MEPLFGTTIQDSLFEPNTDLLVEKITSSVSQAIAYWLPYITIASLNVDRVISQLGAQEEHGITIKLVVSVGTDKANVPITFVVTPSLITLI
jgi:phage baseplate assembly protein W